MKKYLATLLLLLAFTSLNISAEISVSDKIDFYNKIKTNIKNQILNKKNDSKIEKNINSNNSNGLQSSKEIYMLDSLVYDVPELFGLDAKVLFKLEYDERGNNTKLTSFYGIDEETGEYIPSEENNSIYNELSQLIEYSESYYNPEDDEWVLNNKESYLYDENGMLLEKTIYSIFDGEENVYNKEAYIYNEFGNISLVNILVWNEFDSEWTISGKTEYQYDEYGKLIFTMEFYFNGEEWVETSKVEYTYENGNLTKETHSDYTYIDEDTYDWVENYYITNTYNDNNQKIGFESYYKYSEEYELEEKMDYSYDDKGNLSESISYYSDYESNEIVEDTKMKYNYNSDVSKDEFILQNIDFFLEGEFNYMPTKIDLEFWEFDNWFDIGISTKLYYTQRNIEQVGSVLPVNKSIISIYPNPTSDFLNINLFKSEGNASIEILDLNGKSILNQDILSSNSVNIQSLNRGTYIYKIHQKNKVFGGKFIKE